MVVLPTWPIPATSVMTRGRYVSATKSSGAPIGFHSTGGRSNSAEPAAKPSAGSTKAEAATAPAPCAVSVMNRRRVTVSPSNAPAMSRSAAYLDLGVFLGSGTNGRSDAKGRGTISPAGRHAPSDGVFRLVTAAQRRRGGVPRGIGPLRSALRVRLRAVRDQVGEHPHGRQVPALGEPGQAERVQPVAGQQRQVAIARADDAAVAVVLQVALPDRLDDESALAPGRVGAVRIGDGGGDQPAVRP